jgi:hypothetical protein
MLPWDFHAIIDWFLNANFCIGDKTGNKNIDQGNPVELVVDIRFSGCRSYSREE